MNTVVRGTLIAAVIVLAGTVIYQRHQIEVRSQQVTQLQVRAEESPVIISPPLPQSLDVPAPERSATVSRSVSEALPAAGEVIAPEEHVAKASELMMGPEAQERGRDLVRGLLPTLYPDIGKVLGLTPEEEKELLELLARQQSDWLSRAGRDTAGGPATDLAAQRTTRQQANEAELTSTLGARYPQWQEYRRELPIRRQLHDLKIVLDAEGMPLSESQARSLMTALVAAQKRISQDTFQAIQQRGVVLSRYAPENIRTTLDAAAPHLTSQQLEAYRQLLVRQGRLEGAMQPGNP